MDATKQTAIAKARARARRAGRGYAPVNDNRADIFEPILVLELPDEEELAPPENPPPVLLDDEEAPPFDPPAEDDDIFSGFTRLDIEDAPEREDPPLMLEAAPPPLLGDEEPLPPIHIYAAWDRPQSAELFAMLAADPRLSRARIEIGRGGIEGAVLRFAHAPAPDLLLLDTTLRGADMLAALDRLPAGPARIVIGGVNDVSLLRDLRARDVAEYVVAPAAADALARTLCRLFADADRARIIAVIGARGGAGASTIAFNLAHAFSAVGPAALLDLDLAFGAFDPARESSASFVNALDSAETIDAALDRGARRIGPRCDVISAPAPLQDAFDLNPEKLQALMARVRRRYAHVVLDLPHAWCGWVKQALSEADDIVIVASPDLASLRTTDNLLKLLRAERRKPNAPHIVLSMVGAPKRPEIPARDFANAVLKTPVAAIPFDPLLFGRAALANAPLAAIEPDSKAAHAIRALVDTLCTDNSKVSPAPFTDEPITLTPQGDTWVERAYLQQARAAAERQFEHAQTAEAKPQQSSVALRAATALLALVTFGAWQMQTREQSADAAEFTAERALVEQPDASTLALAAYDRALVALAAGDISARPEIERLANAGLAAAQYTLAELQRRDQTPNIQTARQWTERAAGAGHVRAMHDLGVYFAQGEGVTHDDAAAFRWFRQAAEFDVADSQYNLGVLYLQGRGVSADANEALFWFMLAARHGDAGAADHVAALEAELTPMQIEQGRARAAAFRARTPNPIANHAPALQAAATVN